MKLGDVAADGGGRGIDHRLQITHRAAELLAERRANEALQVFLEDQPLTVRECIGVIAGLNRAREQAGSTPR